MMLKNTEIQEIVSKITEKFNPQQIIIFGSYAYGQPAQDSDLDLLVIDDEHPNKQMLAIQISSMLFPRDYGLDLVVTSPEEINVKTGRGLSFWKEIVAKGRKLYER